MTDEQFTLLVQQVQRLQDGTSELHRRFLTVLAEVEGLRDDVQKLKTRSTGGTKK